MGFLLVFNDFIGNKKTECEVKLSFIFLVKISLQHFNF